jgi:hypothetical protein
MHTRKETLRKITQDNQQMLIRLIKGKSTFSVQKWEKDYRFRKELVSKMGKHPYILDKNTLDPESMPGGIRSGFNNTQSMASGQKPPFYQQWQSSTRLEGSPDPNRFNFPIGKNFPTHMSAILTKQDMQNQTLQPVQHQNF